MRSREWTGEVLVSALPTALLIRGVESTGSQTLS